MIAAAAVVPVVSAVFFLSAAALVAVKRLFQICHLLSKRFQSININNK